MISMPLLSPFGGSSLGLIAGDLFLNRFLAPNHLDPLSAADPSQSRFGGAENGDNGGGGGRHQITESFLEEAFKTAPAENIVRLFNAIDADALEEAWRSSENRDDPQRAAHFARLMTGLLMLGEGLEAFYEALWRIPDEKLRSAGLEALRSRFWSFEEFLEQVPQDDLLPAERESADQMLACLRSALGSEETD